MKKILIVMLTALASYKSFSQTDTSRVEQYCEIIATPRLLSALNLIGKEGWLFVNAFPVNIGTTQVYHCGFKKTFLKSDLIN